MKICTITCHDVYNYGASLQAYALQQYLIGDGHDVEIIDYKPDYQNRSYDFWYIPEGHTFYNLCKKSKLFHLLYCIRLIPITYRTFGRIKPFKRFKSDFLKCTQVLYHNCEELISNPPQADVYIAGSDQIWNTNLPNGYDRAFYLNFGKSHIKRISYAASFAISKIPEDYEHTVSDYLSVFDAISVREKTGLSILEHLGYKGVNVLDPVFLLSEFEWRKLFNNKDKIRNKYILLYNIVGQNDIINKAVELIKSALNCEVIAICDKSVNPIADKSITNAGPREFVHYVANAEFVISDSFHATAFSVIFKVPFATYNKNTNSSRISDFLNDLNLQSRFNDIDMSPIPDESIMILQDKIESSKKFLMSSLED